MTSRGPYRRHSTPFKFQLCQDIRAGIIGRRDAQRSHNISANLIQTGPSEPRSTVLTAAEEAAVVAFRRHTLLPLDDCLYALQPSIPHLTRSALHRCLQRHGISRLPDVEGDKPQRQKFKRYPIGFLHIDIAEVLTGEGKLYLFVGIDRTSKFAVAQLGATADRKTAWEFLQHMLEVVPYQVQRFSPIEPLERHWSERQWRRASSSPSSPATGTPSTPGQCAST